MNNREMKAHLIYIMGASGSGKDSLIEFARRSLTVEQRVVFVHRYITRPAETGGENHVALTSEEFALRKQERLFALQWESHGNYYGIGIEINQWLDKGLSVVVNGSRKYLPEVRRLYPEAVPVLIDVSIDTLRDRLLRRGRESEDEITERLGRNSIFRDQYEDSIRICNNGPLEEGGAELVALIQRYSRQVINS